MVEVVRRSPFLVGIVALAVVFAAGFAFSPSVTHGQETDVGVEDSGGLPPQAPIESGPSADTGDTASGLPAAGSGGYLDSGENWQLTAGIAGVILISLGFAFGVSSLRSVRK